jgi:peptidoglycan/LPS O-acetylase OafA/YrhL
MTTIADRVAIGRTSGFDYLRVVLAVSVLVWHSYPLTKGAEAAAIVMSSPLGALIRLVLPMFFALSGFLVAGSLARNPLRTFLCYRGLRIVPALAMEVLLSAVILGPMLTTETAHGYFLDARFSHYFLNIIGLVHYELPGVFTQNPFPDIVNGSLWTVPVELECYVALVVLSVVGISDRPKLLFAAIIFGIAAFLAFSALRDTPYLRIDSALPGRLLVLCFLTGVLLYGLKASIPYSVWAFGGAVVLAIIALSAVRLYVLAPFPAAYITVWLGLRNPRRLPILFNGDYSYGLYLYAFPIQQTWVWLLPWIGYWQLTLLSLVVVSIFAGCSWHVVERRALDLKVGFRTVSAKRSVAGALD